MESQLAERQARRKVERQLKLQEEQGSLSDMAAELNQKMDVRPALQIIFNSLRKLAHVGQRVLTCKRPPTDVVPALAGRGNGSFKGPARVAVPSAVK